MYVLSSRSICLHPSHITAALSPSLPLSFPAGPLLFYGEIRRQYHMYTHKPELCSLTLYITLFLPSHRGTKMSKSLIYCASLRYRFLLQKNYRLLPLCRHGQGLCIVPRVVATACALHPLNLAKTVRLRLASFRPLLKVSYFTVLRHCITL